MRKVLTPIGAPSGFKKGNVELKTEKAVRKIPDVYSRNRNAASEFFVEARQVGKGRKESRNLPGPGDMY